MTQRAQFWTYRAGTEVLTPGGSPLGRVSAVRRHEVLITTGRGESSWISDADVLSYNGSTLTVAATPSRRGPALHGLSLVPSDRLIAERTLRLSKPTVFDA